MSLSIRKVSDESLGWDETSFERLATKLSQVPVNFFVKNNHLHVCPEMQVNEIEWSL